MKATIRDKEDPNAGFRHNDYTVAWITAVPTEMAAAVAMLDERHTNLSTPRNDDNAYVLGRMHIHNIVIACLPAGVYGTTSAATVASQIRATFPSLRFGLLVGIGGGAPSPENDIRLGDVMVSKPTRDSGGVIQYDFGKALSDGLFERTGLLNKPPQVLLTAISQLQAEHMLRPSQISELVSGMVEKYPEMNDKFTYPSNTPDLLFESHCNHVDHESDCVNCDHNQRVKQSDRTSSDPKIHYGLIASANTVMKDGCLRDKLAKELGVLCFEMEAAGLMDNFPCLVVRGICDYADSHKNNHWQPYAAATAAAYAKELLSVVPASRVIEMPTVLFANMLYTGTLYAAQSNPNITRDVLRNNHHDYEKLFRRISEYDHERVHRRLSQKRLTGTTQWFLDHPRFQRWFTEKSFSNLWCSGKIGSGKTMIATAVVDAARHRDQAFSAPTVYFYCENDQPGSLRAASVLSSFVRQLCEHSWRTSSSFPHGYFEKLRKFYGFERIAPDFEDLKRLFEAILYEVPDTIYCVDGIDSLDHENSDKLLKALQSVFCGFRPLNGSRILLLSRDHIEGYINISTFMPGLCQISTSTNVSKDIKFYIDTSIVDKTMYRTLTDDDQLLDHMRSALMAGSDGMFLWVFLQLEIIWSICFTDAEIRFAINRLPKGLEETYQQCVKRINTQEVRVLKVLRWVSYASRPLHIDELREAVAFDVLDTVWDRDKIPQKQFVVGCCANLVVLDHIDQCVRFAHPSVKHYLMQRSADFGFNLSSGKEGEVECGEFCVAYLSFSNFNLWLESPEQGQANATVPKPVLFAGEAFGPFKQFICKWKKSQGITSFTTPKVPTTSPPNKSQFKFLDYATLHWGLQTKLITQRSVVWDKFEHLATNFTETWNFHPWIIGGRSQSSRLHGLFGWAVKEQHIPLLNIAVKSQHVQQICDLPLVQEKLPALHFASKFGYREIVEILLGICNVSSRDVNGYAPLHHAAKEGHLDVVNLILNMSDTIVDVSEPRSMVTPLWLAAENGHDRVVALLIEHNAQLEIKLKSNNRTPLCQAAAMGHLSTVQVLLKAGANAHFLSSDGKTPLYLAAQNRHETVVTLLIDYSLLRHYSPVLMVIGDSYSGKSTIIKQMLLHSGDELEYIAYSRPDVHVEMLNAVLALIRLMLEYGLEAIDARFHFIHNAIMALAVSNVRNTQFELSSDVLEAINLLWNDESLFKPNNFRKEVSLPDPMVSLLNAVDRIADPGYRPTKADWLSFGKVTEKTSTKKIQFSHLTFRTHETPRVIEGEDDFSHHWSHFGFADAKLLVFCFALTEYDQYAANHKTNKLEDNVQFFQKFIESVMIPVDIILFLTKFDRLGDKLLQSPLEAHFPNYTGGCDSSRAAYYILGEFEKVNKRGGQIYSYVIDATNPAKFQKIFLDVRMDIIRGVEATLTKHLK